MTDTPSPAQPDQPPQSLRRKFCVAAINLSGVAAGTGLAFAAGSTGDPLIGGAGIGAGIVLGVMSEMILFANHLLPHMRKDPAPSHHAHVGQFFWGKTGYMTVKDHAKVWGVCAALTGVFGLVAGSSMNTRNINLAAIDAACATKGQPSEPFAMKLPGGKWVVQSCKP